MSTLRFYLLALIATLTLLLETGMSTQAQRAPRPAQDRIEALTTRVDALPAHYPNVEALAKALGAFTPDPTERALVAYLWITRHVTYDLTAYQRSQGRTVYSADDPAAKRIAQEQSAPAVLTRRQGVCQGYAALYQALGAQLGFEAWPVSGYIVDNGKPLIQMTHEWTLLHLPTGWALADATWGAGHLEGGQRFRPSRALKWFMTDPDTFLLEHYPADPSRMLQPRLMPWATWQQGRRAHLAWMDTPAAQRPGTPYAYGDTLAQDLKLPAPERSMASYGRMARSEPNPTLARLKLVEEASQRGLDLLLSYQTYMEGFKGRSAPDPADPTLQGHLEGLRKAAGYLAEAQGWLRGLDTRQADTRQMAREFERVLDHNLKSIASQQAFWARQRG